MLHIKDGNAPYTNATQTAVGAGAIDWDPIPAAAKGHVRWYIRAYPVKVTCKLVNKRRSVRCTVRPAAGESRPLTATVRLAREKAKATRSGRRAVRVTLHAKRRLGSVARVRVVVRSGTARTALALRAR